MGNGRFALHALFSNSLAALRILGNLSVALAGELRSIPLASGRTYPASEKAKNLLHRAYVEELEQRVRQMDE